MLAHYLGPVLKNLRYLNLKTLPGFSSKINKRVKQLNDIDKYKLYNRVIKNKCNLYKLKYIKLYFALNSKQIYAFAQKASKTRNIANVEFIKYLEAKLDTILFRSFFFITIKMARHYILYGHIFINQRKIIKPTYICKINDIIYINTKLIPLVYSNIKYVIKFNLQNTHSINFNYLKICYKTLKIKILNLLTFETLPKNVYDTLLYNRYTLAKY